MKLSSAVLCDEGMGKVLSFWPEKVSSLGLPAAGFLCSGLRPAGQERLFRAFLMASGFVCRVVGIWISKTDNEMGYEVRYLLLIGVVVGSEYLDLPFGLNLSKGRGGVTGTIEIQPLGEIQRLQGC